MSAEHVALIEVLERNGQVRSLLRITQWPLRIGRAPSCDVVIYDPHVAAHHLTIDWHETKPHTAAPSVADPHAPDSSATDASTLDAMAIPPRAAEPNEPSASLPAASAPAVSTAPLSAAASPPVAHLQLQPSVNGAWLDRRKLDPQQSLPLPAEAVLQIGTTQLRWRSQHASVPAELPLKQRLRPLPLPSVVYPKPWLAVCLLMALWLGLLAVDDWLKAEPDTSWRGYSQTLQASVAVVLVWAAVWSLLTQVFQRRFPLLAHLRIGLGFLVGFSLIVYLLPPIAYAFSWPRLLGLNEVLLPFTVIAAVWWHARLVWPAQRIHHWLTLGLVGVTLLGLGFDMAAREERQHWLGPMYLSTLAPPALRMVQPVSTQAFIDSLHPLERELGEQVADEEPAAAPQGAASAAVK